MASFNWRGKSGTVYVFDEYVLIDGTFPNTSGVYIFVREAPNSTRTALYVGETGNLDTRLTSNHEKLPCAQQNGGGTYVHIRDGGSQSDRRAVEADLIGSLNPSCNS